MKNTIIAALFLVLASSGCKTKDGKVYENEKLEGYHDEYSKTLEGKPLLALSRSNLKIVSVTDNYVKMNIVQNLHFIKLVAPDAALIGTIDKIKIADNRVFILDRKTNSIFIFNRQGVFLQKIHNVGKGPTEYIQLRDFALDESSKQLMLYDSQTWRLLSFDYEGNYVGAIDLKYWPRSFEKLGDGICFFTDVETKTQGYHIITTKEQEINAKAVPFTDNHSKLRHYYAIAPFLWRTQDKLDVLIPFNDTIYQITPGSISARYVIDYGSKGLPQRLLQLNKKDFFNEILKNEYAYNLNGVFETSDYMGAYFLGISSGKSSEKVLMIHKNTDRAVAGDIINSEYDIKVRFPFTSINEDTLVSYFYPHEIISAAKLSKSLELTKFAGTLKEYDNPVLITYTLSKF